MCHRSFAAYTWQFLPERRTCEQLSVFSCQALPPLVERMVVRFRAKLQQEGGQSEAKIGIAIDRGIFCRGYERPSRPWRRRAGRVPWSAPQTPGLPEMREIAIRNSSVPFTPIGMVERDRFLAVRGDHGKRLLGAILLHRDRRLGCDGVGGLLERGAAVIHAELAVGRRVPDIAVVAEDRIFGRPSS